MTTNEFDYRNLFAWTGLIFLIKRNPELPSENKEAIIKVIVDIFQSAKNYYGDSQEIQNGYKEVLQSIHLFLTFCPDLETRIINH